MKTKNSWTSPKLKAYPIETGKDWYVWFRYNGGNPIRIKLGLNKIPDYNERLEEALALTEVIGERLSNGWIPENSAKVSNKSISIEDAILYGFEQKKLSVQKNTIDNFRTSVNFFCYAVKKLRFTQLKIGNFERSHAKAILEYLKKEKNWTNKNYNKHLGYLRSIFYEVLEADYINSNPFDNIRNLKVVKNPANIPPTDEEMKLICKELRYKNYGLYIFYMMIYYCGIRPNELRNLKIKNLDFENKNINIDKEFSKNKKDRCVPMLGNIFDLLQYYKGLDNDLYVFGTWVPNGGRHSRKNWFYPNPYRLKEDTPNKEWNKLIKKGLQIDKTLYSAKHKGADDKRKAGMDIKTICALFGHSEEKMTERYMHSLNQERLEQARNIQLKLF